MFEVLFVLLGAALCFVALHLKGRFWSFAAQKPQDYADSGEAFDIRRHLNGPIICEGVIYGPLGRVSSRFVAEFDAEWTGNSGVMKEYFLYDGGTTNQREWHLELKENGRIEATAADVIGTGQGAQVGDSVQLTYRIRLPEASGGHVLDAVDWMYLTPNGTIMNRSQFRKFGIQVAELVATMRPREAADRPVREAA